ncbi:Na(+)-translocating NADH-quinone reductase subunit C [Endozoicomonas sp. OPT23]|uniref:Na(+)-translocating NADH-quinone reductase subunit C n=1 Tax=Endozoicomonas sp. OPT23 TaxID=2072845 RepID=UPI00129BDF3D|nr:Na(+)-translocating NADH-quinone reductase subunit C [Endozoicomonas sp. OPT23]MRI35209.1 Na(+)-translocating NADH-quinone reductase subunit C [Endozoicomonas sp. OPT23]
MSKKAGNDSIQKTLIITVVLSLVCSVLVSAAAVILKPKQDENIVLDVQRNILNISGLTKDAKALSNAEVAEMYKQIQPRLVNVETGKFVKASAEDVAAYDQRAASKLPKESKTLTGAEDIASIRRMANVAKVYVVEKNGKLDTMILPVHGYGLWSTMYGFMALEADLNTIKGFGFYSQAETPGLGGEVDNPLWKAKWPGKKIYDTKGVVEAGLVKGGADPKSKYKVDGLSGATLTSNGVTNLIKFWMGNNGFKPFLNNLKAGDA